MLSRQVKLPNRQQVQKWLDKTWFYTKVLFALSIFGLIAYGWGKSRFAMQANNLLHKIYLEQKLI